MFQRVLVANRGEIALRVIRACREMGIEAVAVYSEADRGAPHLRLASESICVGPPAGVDSYLDIPKIIAAAEIADVEAIHPGYGFLAESAQFAEVCEDCHITFIGPAPVTLHAFGNKVKAREIARAAGAPTVPGSEGAVEDIEEAVSVAAEIGYPVIMKASSGGGGRGMRVAHNEMAVRNQFDVARAEAETAFKDPNVYIERFVENPRHIEIQVVGDMDGHIVHLGERDCSIQRRHQKLIEESPSPSVDDALRQTMGEQAVAVAREGGLTNAATVEFLLDPEGNFYFLEVNARIQVEHPVTEMVTGVDLVQTQIRSAAGEPLPFGQEDVTMTGHAMECRINAEDPDNDFRPCAGMIERFVPPGGYGVRVDTHVTSGYMVPPYYDSLIAKIIVHRSTREETLAAMIAALRELQVVGPPTTARLLSRILQHSDVAAGSVDTSFVEHYFGEQE